MRTAFTLFLALGACTSPRPPAATEAVTDSGLRAVVVTTDKLE